MRRFSRHRENHQRRSAKQRQAVDAFDWLITRRQIERALEHLPEELAVLMIEHDMDFVFRFARRVIVLNEGAIIFEGNPAAVSSDPEVRKAYLGSYANAGRSS